MKGNLEQVGRFLDVPFPSAVLDGLGPSLLELLQLAGEHLLVGFGWLDKVTLVPGCWNVNDDDD